MRPLCIVEGEVARQRRPCITNTAVGPQIDLFVFHRPPKPFDEHIVSPGAAAVHADSTLTTPLINTRRHYTRPRVRENNGCWSSSRVNASISGCNQRSGIVGIRS